jgi:hypothetical protein
MSKKAKHPTRAQIRYAHSLEEFEKLDNLGRRSVLSGGPSFEEIESSAYKAIGRASSYNNDRDERYQIYNQMVEWDGLWKTWETLVPLAVGLHFMLGTTHVESNRMWIQVLEIAYTDFKDVKASCYSLKREREQVDAADKKISAADSKRVKNCEECQGGGRVYVTEGMWATCSCVGGDGLTTDYHYY